MKSSLPEFHTVETTIDKVSGLDPEIQKFLDELGYVPDISIDLSAWSEDAARLIYARLPMFVIQRKSGNFDVVGDGRAHMLAQKLFLPDMPFPVNLLKAKRLNIQTKLAIVAAEIYGLTPLYRTRRNLPTRSMEVWNALKSNGVDTILGDGPMAFSRGSGYSLASLTKRSADPKQKCELEPDES